MRWIQKNSILFLIFLVCAACAAPAPAPSTTTPQTPEAASPSQTNAPRPSPTAAIPAPTAAETAIPLIAEDASPYTANPAVDATIQLLLNGQSEALTALVQFSTLPCTYSPVMGGPEPECPAGILEGTPVSFLIVTVYEYTYAWPYQLQQLFEHPEPKAFAILKSPQRQPIDESFPPVAFTVILSFYSDQCQCDTGVVYWLTESGNIFTVDFFYETLDKMIEYVGGEVLFRSP